MSRLALLTADESRRYQAGDMTASERHKLRRKLYDADTISRDPTLRERAKRAYRLGRHPEWSLTDWEEATGKKRKNLTHRFRDALRKDGGTTKWTGTKEEARAIIAARKVDETWGKFPLPGGAELLVPTESAGAFLQELSEEAREKLLGIWPGIAEGVMPVLSIAALTAAGFSATTAALIVAAARLTNVLVDEIPNKIPPFPDLSPMVPNIRGALNQVVSALTGGGGGGGIGDGLRDGLTEIGYAIVLVAGIYIVYRIVVR
tara:strand:- start:473 stop:1255 length:783 start_codon:yes stop_codon:yes gene_type:complete